MRKRADVIIIVSVAYQELLCLSAPDIRLSYWEAGAAPAFFR